MSEKSKGNSSKLLLILLLVVIIVALLYVFYPKTDSPAETPEAITETVVEEHNGGGRTPAEELAASAVEVDADPGTEAAAQEVQKIEAAKPERTAPKAEPAPEPEPVEEAPQVKDLPYSVKSGEMREIHPEKAPEPKAASEPAPEPEPKVEAKVEPKEAPAEKPVDTEKVYTEAEVMPQFQGGDLNKFTRYVASKVVYPEMAMEAGLTGTVQVGFTVERDGTVTNVHIVKNADPVLNEEALRVVKRSPKWTPATIRGTAVRVKQVIPVVFYLR